MLWSWLKKQLKKVNLLLYSVESSLESKNRLKHGGSRFSKLAHKVNIFRTVAEGQ